MLLDLLAESPLDRCNVQAFDESNVTSQPLQANVLILFRNHRPVVTWSRCGRRLTASGAPCATSGRSMPSGPDMSCWTRAPLRAFAATRRNRWPASAAATSPEAETSLTSSCWTVSNGMDAPTRRRHRRARVEVSATTRTGRSVHYADYDSWP